MYLIGPFVLRIGTSHPFGGFRVGSQAHGRMESRARPGRPDGGRPDQARWHHCSSGAPARRRMSGGAAGPSGLCRGGGPRVIGGTSRVNLSQVSVGPAHQRPRGIEERGAERGERVLDPRRYHRVHGAADDPVPFQPAQRHRQHPLAHPVDAAFQAGKALRPVTEVEDHLQRPFVADALKDLPDPASAHDIAISCHGYLRVTKARRCAVLRPKRHAAEDRSAQFYMGTVSLSSTVLLENPGDTMTAPAVEFEGYVAGTWELDPVHSHIGFVARHLMVSKVRGHFTTFHAEIITA